MRKISKIWFGLAFLVMCVSVGTGNCKAAGETTGACGNHVTWEYKDGVLTISGTGDMKNYLGDLTDEEDREEIIDDRKTAAPWSEYEDLITTVVIENGVTTVGNGSFIGMEHIQNVTIADTVTKIGDGAFSGCEFTSITIPGSVETIGNCAFFRASKLTTVNLQDGLVSISECAFKYCRKLTSIEIPQTVISIERDAFRFAGIGEITWGGIPQLETIGRGCFNYCPIETFVIPASVTMINPEASLGLCENIVVEKANKKYTSVNGVLFSKNKKTLIQYPAGRENVTYKIPSGTVTIGKRAFDSEFLKKLIMPNTLTTVGYCGVSRCPKLSEVVFSKKLTTIKEGGFAGSQLKSISLPSTLKFIGAQCFDCHGMTKLVIPSNVTKIKYGAFYNMYNLKSIIVKSKKIKTFEDEAFMGMRNKQVITVPSSKYNYYNVLFNKKRPTAGRYKLKRG